MTQTFKTEMRPAFNRPLAIQMRRELAGKEWTQEDKEEFSYEIQAQYARHEKAIRVMEFMQDNFDIVDELYRLKIPA